MQSKGAIDLKAKMDYFNFCPDIVLIRVFQFVPIFDLVKNCTLVCRRWNEICCSESVMKTKEVSLFSRSELVSEELVSSAYPYRNGLSKVDQIVSGDAFDEKFIGNLIELGIKNIKLVDIKIINSDLLTIKENNLKAFSAEKVDNRIVEKIMSSCPHITKLTLKFMEMNDNIIKLIKANSMLEKLELTGTYGFELISNLQHLSTCKMLSIQLMDFQAVNQILSSCPNIATLNLGNVELEIPFVPQEQLTFQKIRKLEISELDIIFLEQILSIFPNITDLNLIDIIIWKNQSLSLQLLLTTCKTLSLESVDFQVVEQILSSCPNITALTLGSIELRTPFGPQWPLTFEKLEKLEVFNVDVYVLEQILSSCPNIKDLSLNCDLNCEDDNFIPRKSLTLKKLKKLQVHFADIRVIEHILASSSNIIDIELKYMEINENICHLIAVNSQLETLKLEKIKREVKTPLNLKDLVHSKKLKEASFITVDADILESILLRYCDIDRLELKDLTVTETICQLITNNMKIKKLTLSRITGKYYIPIDSTYFPGYKKLNAIVADEVDVSEYLHFIMLS